MRIPFDLKATGPPPWARCSRAGGRWLRRGFSRLGRMGGGGLAVALASFRSWYFSMYSAGCAGGLLSVVALNGFSASASEEQASSSQHQPTTRVRPLTQRTNGANRGLGRPSCLLSPSSQYRAQPFLLLLLGVALPRALIRAARNFCSDTTAAHVWILRPGLTADRPATSATTKPGQEEAGAKWISFR